MTSVRIRISRRVAASVALAALLATPFSHASDSDDARAVVEGLYRALVATAAIEPALDQPERNAALAPVVTEAFDLGRMGRLAAGRYFSRWSEEESASYLDAFRRLSIAQHASNFASLGADDYQIVDSTPVNDGKRMDVSAVIKRKNGEDDVSLVYWLESDGTSWRIVNVIRMGISSEISALKDEYHTILIDGDLNDLLAELEDQIAACNAANCYER